MQSDDHQSVIDSDSPVFARNGEEMGKRRNDSLNVHHFMRIEGKEPP